MSSFSRILRMAILAMLLLTVTIIQVQITTANVQPESGLDSADDVPLVNTEMWTASDLPPIYP